MDIRCPSRCALCRLNKYTYLNLAFAVLAFLRPSPIHSHKHSTMSGCSGDDEAVDFGSGAVSSHPPPVSCHAVVVAGSDDDDDDTSDDDDDSTSTSDDGQAVLALPKIKIKRRKRVLEPKANAPWQLMLNKAEQPNGVSDPDSIDGRYFRRRFRIPYSLFIALIKVMLDDLWFPGDYDAEGRGKCCRAGRPGASLQVNARCLEHAWFLFANTHLQVKVLSTLRVLGRRSCFDELYDGSGLSESVLSRFFHRFVAMFANRLFYKVVTPPQTEEQLTAVVRIYDMLGMAGAFGSTDCTHIALGKCPNSWKNSCIGKEGFPTLAFSMTCDHTRRIMACSGGFPGS